LKDQDCHSKKGRILPSPFTMQFDIMIKKVFQKEPKVEEQVVIGQNEDLDPKLRVLIGMNVNLANS